MQQKIRNYVNDMASQPPLGRLRTLHKQINCQGKQGDAAVFLTVACHEQQKQYDHQITGIQIFRK
jgi:hypothetical protein